MGREFAIGGRIADTQTENVAAQKKENDLVLAETKSESKENTRGRIRSVSDTERNPESHAEAESEEEDRGKRNLAETEEEKENRRRKIAKSAQSGFAQTIGDSAGKIERVPAARDCRSKSKRTAATIWAKIDTRIRRAGRRAGTIDD